MKIYLLDREPETVKWWQLYFSEQPVGTSFLIEIPGSTKKLIHTQTMRVPSLIREPSVVYQCMRTTLICARQNNVKSLVIPAFGGSCGGIPAQKLAYLIGLQQFLQLFHNPLKRIAGCLNRLNLFHINTGNSQCFNRVA